jgi:single-stranded DNA-specific DHH superfamily exonuclease
VLADWIGAHGCAVAFEPGRGTPCRLASERIELEDAVARADGVEPALAPAGLAFYVCAAARAAARAAGRPDGPDPRTLLDVVALGTIVGGSELRAENRVLVAAGLRTWRERPRPGVQALAEAAAIDAPTSALVAGRPRLDAAVMGGSQGALLALLGTSSAGEARALAVSLELDAAARKGRTALQAASPNGAVLVDAEVPLPRLTPGFLAALGRLEPHGPGNPEPVFLAREVRVEGRRLLGDPLRPRWRIRLRQDGRTRRATALRSGVDVPPPGTYADVAYVPRLPPGGGPPGDVELAIRALWARAAENPQADAP